MSEQPASSSALDVTDALGVEVPVDGLPDGLTAHVPPRRDGRVPVDRKRRMRVTKVIVANLSAQEADATLPDSLLRWVLGAESRRWAGIVNTHGRHARRIALELAQAGAVHLTCEVTDSITLGQVISMRLSPQWSAKRQEIAASAGAVTAEWESRARAAASSMDAVDPGFAAALRAARGTSSRIAILTHAAEDLIAETSHEGPRAFSQAHFGDTKKYEDAPRVLRDAGVGAATIVQLGLDRSPYIGLAGPILLEVAGRCWDLSGHAGPTLVRLTPSRPASARLAIERASRLLVIENLQAAEAVSDRYPEVPIVYCSGQPSDETLAILARLVNDADEVLIATDADLGGVRIAKRLLGALTDVRATVLDVGVAPHAEGRPFGGGARQLLEDLTTETGQVGLFARACLDRGYQVEQEAVIRAVVTAALDQHP